MLEDLLLLQTAVLQEIQESLLQVAPNHVVHRGHLGLYLAVLPPEDVVPVVQVRDT